MRTERYINDDFTTLCATQEREHNRQECRIVVYMYLKIRLFNTSIVLSNRRCKMISCIKRLPST